MEEDNLEKRVSHNYLRRTINGSIRLLTFTAGYMAVWTPVILYGEELNQIIPFKQTLPLAFLTSMALGMSAGYYVSKKINQYIDRRFFN